MTKEEMIEIRKKLAQIIFDSETIQILLTQIDDPDFFGNTSCSLRDALQWALDVLTEYPNARKDS